MLIDAVAEFGSGSGRKSYVHHYYSFV